MDDLFFGIETLRLDLEHLFFKVNKQSRKKIWCIINLDSDL